MNDDGEYPWPSEQFLCGLDHLEADRGHEALRALNAALDECAGPDYREHAAFCLRWIGAAYARLDDADAALDAFLQALALLEDDPLTELSIECAHLAGLGLFVRDRYDEAKPYLRAASEGLRLIAEQAMEDYDKEALIEAIADTDDALADVLEAAGEHAQALALYRSAAQEYERIGEIEQARDSRYGCVTAVMALEESEAALEEFAALRVLLDRLGSTSDAAQCSYMIGVIHQELGDSSRAETELLRARAELDPIDDEVAIARCDESLGELYQATERVEAAIDMTIEAKMVFERHGLDEDGLTCSARLMELYPIHVMGLMEAGRFDEVTGPMDVMREICDKAELPEALAEFDMSRGIIFLDLARYPEAAAAFDNARDLYRDAGDDSKALLCEVYSASTEFHTGDLASAEHVLLRASEIFAQEPNPLRHATTQRMLGLAAILRGAFDEARRLLKEVYDYASETDNQELMAECGHDLGEALILRGDFDAAIIVLTEAAELCESAHEWLFAAACRLRAATAEFHRGRYASAEVLLYEARTMFDRNGADRQQLAVEVLLAQVLYESGRFDDSERALRRAGDLSRRTAFDSDRAVIHMTIGSLDVKRGKYLEAADSFAAAEEIFRRAGVEHMAVACLQNRGMAAAMRGELLVGRELTDLARRYYESQPSMRWNLATTYRNLASAEVRLGNYDSALSYLGLARTVCQEFGRFSEMAHCDYTAATAVIDASDAVDMLKALDLGLPAITFLDAQRLQFPDATSRVAWRNGISDVFVSTLFDWVRRSGDPALMADLVEMTINSGTHTAAQYSGSSAAQQFSSLESVLATEVSKLSYIPVEPGNRTRTPRMSSAAAFVSGAALPVRPPPRLLMPDGHVALGRYIDSADNRYGVIERPPTVCAW